MTADNNLAQTQQLFYTQQIIDQLPTERATYLILDGAGFDALKLIFADGTTTPEFMLLYHDTQLNEQLKISPVIVRYDNNPTLKSRIQEWLPYAVAFNTTTTLIDTVEHLKSLIYCQLPNTQPAFFRFYGQNWLESLITGQDQNTLYAFTGPIDQWYIPQSNQRWKQLTISEQRPSKTAEDYAWFKLTEKLQAKLTSNTEQQFIDQLMDELGYYQLSDEEQVIQREKLIYYIKDAQHYGITQSNQISHFIELALQFSKEIESQPIINLLADQTTTAYEKLQQLENQLYGLA